MKKMLMVATVPSMIGQFNMNNIQLLQEIGYEVHVACNFFDRTVWNDERVKWLQRKLEELGVKCFQIDFVREPLKIWKHKKSYDQVLELIQKNQYIFIHCHTPIASVIARMVSHKEKIKCIYTAHGFHFFEGAPKRNWALFYPIEKFFSKWTDTLIVINFEDYSRAKENFFAKRVVKIPGVGIDTKKIQEVKIDVDEKRKELGIPKEAFLLLSVGELQERKNCKVVIEALHELNDSNIYYLMVGQGELKDEYEALVHKYNLENNIKLLGYRKDVIELCKMADCFVHPSVREGLGIAPLEAMAAGLPLISSYVNGIRDYTEDGVTGRCIVNPLSISDMVSAITEVYKNKELRQKCTLNNKEIALNYDIKITDNIMKQVYLEM